MSSDATPVTIRVLDKEYMISCPPSEREALIRTARILDERMKQTRDQGKVYGAERIAVLSALNLIHESLQGHRQQENESQAMEESIANLTEKVDAALAD